MNPDVRTPSGSHRALYTWLVVAVVAPVGAVLSVILWHTAYPVSEGVAIVEDVSDPSDLTFLWPTRYFYRPLLFLSIFVAWHASDSPATLVVASRLMTIAPVVILVGLLVVHLRPRSAADTAAATLAFAVLLGSSVFFDNIEIPLAYTTVGMPVLLGMWMLAERTKGPAPVALFLSLAVVALRAAYRLRIHHAVGGRCKGALWLLPAARVRLQRRQHDAQSPLRRAHLGAVLDYARHR